MRAGWITGSVGTSAAACILLVAAGAVAAYGVHRRHAYATVQGTPAGSPAIALMGVAFVALLSAVTALLAIVELHGMGAMGARP